MISTFFSSVYKMFKGVRAYCLALVIVSSSTLSYSAYAADKIIVSGASGQLGGLVVEELLNRGVAPEDLILVSRTIEKLDHYREMGASVRFGDFNEPDSLSEAYAGGDRMLLISIGGQNRPAKHKAAIDAAKGAGVKQIAYTSFVNMENNEMPLAADHRQTEQFLKDSGVAWTMLRNQIYMNNIAGTARQLAGLDEIVVPLVEDKLAYVTREDCAAAAAAVLTTPGHENKAYDITGPAAIGVSDIARAVSAISGKDISIEVGDNPSPRIRMMAGGETLMLSTNTVEVLTGRPATSVQQFLEANKSDFIK